MARLRFVHPPFRRSAALFFRAGGFPSRVVIPMNEHALETSVTSRPLFLPAARVRVSVSPRFGDLFVLYPATLFFLITPCHEVAP